MERTIHKAFFDFEKEEKFLNRMAANGLALKQYSWCKYVFEDTPKGEYTYRLELLKHPLDHQESQDYIQFMEETGAELVTSYHRWAYFRKKSTDGPFTIFSDNVSIINHYQRILVFFLLVIAFNFIIGFYNLFTGAWLSGQGHNPINTYVAIASLSVVVLLLLFLVLPLVKKIDTIKKETIIHE
ncbi:DUF2812 domain-containing protein [Bacillus rubiinfantis]|uniref:DUF2812 domain-containing protein n=1 Tax=Bacillus rubiinfantis TaxID=1499680 RepID=UPI0005A9E374|nr:DUF2812 domain-containing protein [Bacillus rubiinfantis]